MTPSVLSVATDTARRGGPIFAWDLGNALAARGRGVRTVALAPGDTNEPMPMPTLGRNRLGIATLRSLRREARDVRVVIAHGSTTLPACAGALVASGVPFIYRNIGDPTYWSNTPAKRARTRFLLSRAAAIVALSERTAAPLRTVFGVSPEKIRLIPRGVPPERHSRIELDDRTRARARLDLSADDRVVVYVGALSPEKNLEAAIAAVLQLEGATLLVAGDGPDRERLTAMAPDRNRIRFLGAVPAPRAVLEAADVVVLPSKTEGIPGILVEAGLSELPVVATRVGAVEDVVLDGVTGRLVTPGDVGGLRDALGQVLASPRGFGIEARSHCLRKFNIDTVADAWDDLLETLGAWDVSTPAEQGVDP